MSNREDGPATPPARAEPRNTARHERLKAALKANMARRKAQAKARKTPPSRADDTPG